MCRRLYDLTAQRLVRLAVAITRNQYNGASRRDAAPRSPRRSRFSVALIPHTFSV
jgi:hypothetical protein